LEKRLRLSDDDRMLMLLALADYAESHAEYHGLDGKVWTLAERLTGASLGPAPQNVALWIREQTGTLNGPMDTYLPNGQVPNEQVPSEEPIETVVDPSPQEPVADLNVQSHPPASPATPTREQILRAWQDGRNYQRGLLERERESIKKRYGWRDRGKKLDAVKRCQVPGCRIEAYGMTPTWLVVCNVHYPETPPDGWHP
jgi:hypothetical protein